MCGTNGKEMSKYSEQLKNRKRKNEKIIEIKICNFTLKLTNWRRVERKDYAALFVFTMVSLSLTWVCTFIQIELLLLYYYPLSGFLLVLYYMKIYFSTETVVEDIKQSKEEKNPILFNLLRMASDYFPVRLIKTADLPADKNYLLACYPHGIVPVNAVPNFSTNFNNRDKLFPGISMRVAIHNILLHVPFIREFHLNVVNACSCSASALKHILNGAPSNAVVIYPGGASEICLSDEGDTYKIIKSRRKGFIRIALQTGASLVPVFTFGEINMYKTYPLRGSGKPTFGVDLLTVRGRGYFQHHFGFLPHSIPINTVVGKPIAVPQVENPSTELIDEYHEKFFNDLETLFDEHKGTCDIAGEDAKLVMI